MAFEFENSRSHHLPLQQSLWTSVDNWIQNDGDQIRLWGTEHFHRDGGLRRMRDLRKFHEN